MADALGMIETIGLVGALEAADAGLKAADVQLLGTDYVRGGWVCIRFAGEVAAVKVAVEAGALAAGKVGQLFTSHVIARAADEVVRMACGAQGPGGCVSCGGCEGARRSIRGQALEHALPNAGEAPSAIDRHTPIAQLERWKVVTLRQAARRLEGFPMTPNEIRYAGKRALIETIHAWQMGEDE